MSRLAHKASIKILLLPCTVLFVTSSYQNNCLKLDQINQCLTHLPNLITL